MRVLVTGSRDWTDTAAIRDALARIRERQEAAFRGGTDVTLVSGACPTGADAIAEQAAEGMGWRVERHPADWARHGRCAGHIRNVAMVDLGADICLAYILDGSREPAMMAGLADAASIYTVVHRAGTAKAR